MKNVDFQCKLCRCSSACVLSICIQLSYPASVGCRGVPRQRAGVIEEDRVEIRREGVIVESANALVD
eukprot:3421519-Rhodomonas_salina.1